MPVPHPLLSGPFAPLPSELDLENLSIEGTLPAGLEGVLYRIGPNPRFPPLGDYNPLQGEGMVHAFRLGGGRAGYRNRWIRTRRWRMEDEAGRALFATGDPRASDPVAAGVDGEGAANTHVLMHGGRLLALEEGSRPIALDPDSLDTLGAWDFAGRLPGAMTAHPRIDPTTGAMIAFTNFPDRRFNGDLLVHAIDRDGALTRSTRVRGPWPALVHDFAITATRIVFVVCPLVLSLERAMSGRSPIAWEPGRGAMIGVMRRDGDGADLRWLDAPTAMVWHLMNAFDDGEDIVADLCSQAAAAFPTADGAPPLEADLRQHLERWTIRPGAEAVARRRLGDVVCEYPRIDERRTGLPYRFGYVAAEGGPGTGDLSHRALGRFDHDAGEMVLWRAPPGHCVSEPVFVPRSEAEGDGWLLATLFDEARDTSSLAVLDAMRIEDGPVARVLLDHRVPAGFHGSFVRARSEKYSPPLVGIVAPGSS